MAYENMTYENILHRLIERVRSKYPNVDTREGSIIFNALAPAAVELAIAYIALDTTLAESFVKTASRPYILLACEESGIDINMFEAHAGTFKGEFDVEVPIGSRWNCDLHNYVVTEQLASDNEYFAYAMKCETVGSGANTTFGSLTAITDVPNGLTYAEVTACLIEGENEYSDEEVQEYYYNFVNSTISDGNTKQYEQWCEDYDGIGGYKVFPLWNGANTVKVSILSSSNRKASDTLLNEYQNYLDPGITGMGDGKAPIGAFVTVSTATEVPMAVNATITMKPGYSDTSSIDAALTDYFAQISYDKRQVAYMSVGAIILNVEGVDSVNDLLINGSTADIQLGEEEIPTLSVTNWTVI